MHYCLILPSLQADKLACQFRGCGLERQDSWVRNEGLFLTTKAVPTCHGYFPQYPMTHKALGGSTPRHDGCLHVQSAASQERITELAEPIALTVSGATPSLWAMLLLALSSLTASTTRRNALGKERLCLELAARPAKGHPRTCADCPSPPCQCRLSTQACWPQVFASPFVIVLNFLLFLKNILTH